MEFKCSTPTGDDLCFNGGNCSVLPGGAEFCSCPTGLVGDFTRLYFPNCLLPDTFYLYSFIAFAVLVACTLSVLLYVTFPLAKGHMRVLAVSIVVNCTLIAAQYLSRYLEGGCRAGCSMLDVLAGISSNITSYYSMTIILTPVETFRSSRLKLESFKRKLQWLFGLESLALLILGIARAVLASHVTLENLKIFNTFVLCQYVLGLVFICLGMMVFMGMVTELVKILDQYGSDDLNKARSKRAQSNERDASSGVEVVNEPSSLQAHIKKNNIVQRLKAIRFSHFMILLSLLPLVILLPLVFALIGSFPYLFVLETIVHFMAATNPLSISYFIRIPQEKSDLPDPSACEQVDGTGRKQVASGEANTN